MIDRIAFFAKKNEVEEYFGFRTDIDHLFEPKYNISPGQTIPVLLEEPGKNPYKVINLFWGGKDGGIDERPVIEVENVEKLINEEGALRCLLPLSGFYVWKNNDKKGSPFFVRMLNQPFMAVAGVCHLEKDYVMLVITESNPLIQPMSEKMPLILDEKYAVMWIDKTRQTDKLAQDASNLFLLTDLSVLRVSKKVNNPGNSGPKLIQPIPK